MLAAAVLLAPAAPALAQMVTLSGEVTYRERIALPDGALLRIRLIDETAPGSPARVEAEALISGGQVPLTFTLNFDTRAIDPGHDHALVAEISASGQLWFRNEPYAIAPLSPDGPVLIVASFVGRLGEPQEPETAPAVAADGLLETTWRAETIGGEATLPTVDSTLSITRELRAGGRAGCNSYFAQAAIAGDTLRFSAVGATRMACLSSAATAQETRFIDALGATHRWRIEDGRLMLLDEAGNELVRFARTVR